MSRLSRAFQFLGCRTDGKGRKRFLQLFQRAQIGCWDPATRWPLSQLPEPLLTTGLDATPVDWQKDQRPYAHFERQDDWSGCAYFYLNRRTNGLPSLCPVAERIVDLDR